MEGQDSDQFPAPQVLPSSFDRWRSPLVGFPARDAGLFVVVETMFTRQEFTLKLGGVFALLVQLLGDHRVTIESHMNARDVRDSKLGWRFKQYNISLQCMLSWLATDEGWAALGPIGSSTFSIEACRGGGRSRHLVWEFEWDSDSTARLRVRTKHFTGGEATEVNGLVSAFMRASVDAGASYGRGALLDLPDRSHRYPDPKFEPLDAHSRWIRAFQSGRPTVPGVHRVNLLDRARLEKLGGLAALQPYVVRRNGLILEPYGDSVIVWTERLSTVAFSGFEGYVPFHAEALLSLFAKAGMLPVQNMDWIEAETPGWRKEADPSTRTRVLKMAPMRRRPMSEWLMLFQTRPPAFLSRVAAPLSTMPTGALPARLAEEFNANTVHFAVQGPEGKAAFTLYGSPAGDPVLLAGPLLIGAPTMEKALAVFDPARDGWDGRCTPPEDRPPTQPGRRRLKQLKCPGCDGRFFRLRAVLEYPEDLDELSEENQAQAEEYFTWLWIIASCQACGWAGIAADIECA